MISLHSQDKFYDSCIHPLPSEHSVTASMGQSYLSVFLVSTLIDSISINSHKEKVFLIMFTIKGRLF